MTRTNRPINVRKHERKAIALFCATRLTKNEGGYVFVSDLHDAFSQVYSGRISIDSFGRMIPSNYERQILSHPGERTRRAIIGFKLEDK